MSAKKIVGRPMSQLHFWYWPKASCCVSVAHVHARGDAKYKRFHHLWTDETLTARAVFTQYPWKCLPQVGQGYLSLLHCLAGRKGKRLPRVRQKTWLIFLQVFCEAAAKYSVWWNFPGTQHTSLICHLISLGYKQREWFFPPLEAYVYNTKNGWGWEGP